MKNLKDKLEFFKNRKKAMRNMGAAAIKMESASWISLKFCFAFKIQVIPSFPQGDTWCLCLDSFTVLSGHQVTVVNHLSREEATSNTLWALLLETSQLWLRKGQRKVVEITRVSLEPRGEDTVWDHITAFRYSKDYSYSLFPFVILYFYFHCFSHRWNQTRWNQIHWE